jgi:hypothetical protein
MREEQEQWQTIDNDNGNDNGKDEKTTVHKVNRALVQRQRQRQVSTSKERSTSALQ